MTECDLIELRSLSQIQSNGFLVCTHFQKDSMRMCVRSVSSNIGKASFSSLDDPRLFVGKCVPECFSTHVSSKMSTLLVRHLGNKPVHCNLTCSDQAYFMTLTRTQDGLVFEILPGAGLDTDILESTRRLAKLTAQTEYSALFDVACAMVTDTVDYDRAMIYEFQEDLSGKVVYEKIKPAKIGTLEPFLDMYFPGSDIPLPARQMFMLLPLRVVFDNDSDPVPMTCNTDLTKCKLRASHPVHSTYMKNMGVRSSMSVAIIVDSELWGLMCFHSYGEAVHPQGWESVFFESLSIFFSSCVSKIRDDKYQKRRRGMSSVFDKGFCADHRVFFEEHALEILRVMEADCLSVAYSDRVQSWGDTGLAVTTDEAEHVSKDAAGKEWVLSELKSPPRGVLCVVHDDLVLVLLRKGTCHDKLWGGDPFYTKLMRPDGVPGPRGSFERYVQSGADCLNLWSLHDKRLVTFLSSRMKAMSTKFVRSMQVLGPQGPQGQVGYHTTPKLDPAILSHFSHELKTPIHTISGALTLLLEKYDMTPMETRQHLLHALKCVKSISKITESVLTIAGGSEYSATTRNMERLRISTFIDTLREEFGNNITTTSAVDEDHDHVLVDTGKLHEVLCAIIDNSLLRQDTDAKTRMSVSSCCTHREATMAWNNETKAYSHRNIRNSEDTSGIMESDVWYTFSIQDSGCGIHRDMLDNVLASDRASTAITNSHQGVGVDIYRCISLVFGMNGSIGIASTVSKGSFFSIMLPAQVVVASGIRHGNNPKSTIPAEDVGVFLIVDDNTINRQLATKLVAVACKKKLGVLPIIKAYSDGKLCVEEVKSMRDKGEKIMGILMDHHMPVMSGREATAIIRDIELRESLDQIPIFGFTADSTGGTREELLRSGMNDVLPKPLSMSLLEEACLGMI